MQFFIITLKDLPQFQGRYKKSELRRWGALRQRTFYANGLEILREPNTSRRDILTGSEIAQVEVFINGERKIITDLDKFFKLVLDK